MILILTGAGISRESGLDTFRDPDGIWARVRMEDVGTAGAYARNPEQVLAFANTLRRELLAPRIAPNAAHHALARLERESREAVLLVTQNVDNLHERAGSVHLLHMHGELLKIRCTRCGMVRQWEEDVTLATACPECAERGRLRPHIVWFEETPFHLREIERALARCRVFVSIGTSGNVWPAAGFAGQARAGGAFVLELNLERSLGTRAFHEGRYGRATEIVPAWVEEALATSRWTSST
ncbi:MAG: NAD-dependent deacylase [Desulfovibrio sp.]|jgi:NAD-dependent deacetylase|nr:NAD-dependent deacylase [Desulfovibrio sp.]